MASVTIPSDFGAQENKVYHCFHCFPIYLPKSDGTRCYDLSFWILSFKSAFSLSFFAFIKRLFSSSLHSAINVLSSAYLRLLMNDAKAETPVLWPPHVKSWLIGKDSVAGRDWGQEKKGMTEDEMAGWHHPLDGSEFEWTPRVGDGHGGLAWVDKDLDTTEWLNWTELWDAKTYVNVSQRLF